MKMKIVYNGMPQILIRLYRCQDGVFDVSALRDSCWKTFHEMKFYRFDLPQWKGMHDLRHRTIAGKPCLPCLAGHETFVTMEEAATSDEEGILIATGNRRVLLKNREVQRTKYRRAKREEMLKARRLVHVHSLVVCHGYFGNCMMRLMVSLDYVLCD